jgi:hypothetical protein
MAPVLGGAGPGRPEPHRGRGGSRPSRQDGMSRTAGAVGAARVARTACATRGSRASRQAVVSPQARGGFQSGRGGSGVFGTLPCMRWLTNAASVGWAR